MNKKLSSIMTAIKRAIAKNFSNLVKILTTKNSAEIKNVLSDETVINVLKFSKNDDSDFP